MTRDDGDEAMTPTPEQIDTRSYEVYLQKYGEPPLRRMGPGWDVWEEARRQLLAEQESAGA